ncbi:MAG: TonB C-terminal domain-containing protein [Gemmatimonadales bacterium]
MTASAERLPRGAVWVGFAGTTAIHLVAFGILVFGGLTRQPLPSLPTYAVELIAAPAGARVQPKAPPRADPEAPPVAPPAAKAAPAKPRVRAEQPTRSRATTTAPPLPGERPNTGTDIANVKYEGKPFPYPEYLRNLVTQIYRRWNRPPGDLPLEAEVGFVILRDGTVRSINLMRSSKSYSFDQEALGAVEAAGQVKAFGPLPAGYEPDYLQVSFVFAPRRQ